MENDTSIGVILGSPKVILFSGRAKNVLNKIVQINEVVNHECLMFEEHEYMQDA